MAYVSIDSSHGVTQKNWENKFYKEYLDETFWRKFMGTSENSPIQVKMDLTKKEGDAITFTLVTKLTGDGVTGDTTLEGKEESLNVYTQTVTVDQVRNAVKLKGKMTEKRSAINLRNAAKTMLKSWISEKTDNDIFTALSASPTAGRKYFVGGGSATSDIGSSDTLTVSDILALKAQASTGSGGSYRKIRPIAFKNGVKRYCFVMDSYAAKSLKESSDYKDWVKSAGVRGENNPLFTGALADIDGILLFEHDGVITANDGGSSIRVARNLFFGAQAGVLGWAQKTFWKEEVFDYDNQVGFAVGEMRGIEKAKFNDLDHGVIVAYSAAIVS